METATERNEDKLFIGDNNKLHDWQQDPETKIRALLKNYLELDNVSFLFGAGSSMNLGSISIADIPDQVVKSIKSYLSETIKENELFEEFRNILQLLKKNITIEEDKSVNYPVEDLLDYLTALSFIKSKSPDLLSLKHVDDLIKVIKKALFELCDLDVLPLPAGLESSVKKLLEDNKYHFHQAFIKKLLQRQLNLRRANVFTINYDLAFEYAFDNLGVRYLDGFSGFNSRTFKPEGFDYDIFYPGSTTQGRVNRIEKVIKYFKLHGSLTWIAEKPEPQNIYGIKEYPIDFIRSKKDSNDNIFNQLMIYPSATKKTYTLEYPFSELFRQFANSIIQSQSVLFTYGYSFGDEHINDIINQALSIPSFTLIIIDYYGTGSDVKPNQNIRRLKELNDPRIIIIQGEHYGDFPFFVQNLLPDLVEMDNDFRLASTLKKLYEGKENDKEQNIESTNSET